MQKRRDRRLWSLSGAFLFLGLFSLFLSTFAPSLYLDDSGETVTVAALLGIGHPPGYPFYTLLSHGWQSWALGGVSSRLNLLAAFLGAFTATLLYAWLSHRRSRRFWPLAAGTAVLLSAGPVFWHNALVAKGGLYQLNNLMTVGLLALLAWEGELSVGRVRAFWALLGIALAHHYMSQLPCLPAYAWLLLAPGRLPRRQRLGAAWLTLLGLGFYAYLPLRAAQEPGLDWGGLRSWHDWGFFLLRGQYAAAELTRSLSGSAAQAWTALKLLWREGAGLLGPAALASAVCLRRHRTVQALGLLWLATVAAVTLYLNLATERLDIMQPYLFPAYLAQAALAGLGAMAAWDALPSLKLRWLAGSAAGAWILTALAVTYPTQDLHAYYFAEDNARDLLQALPPRALLFAQGDATIFPLWYEQRVAGRRLDVAVVGNAVLPMRWVRQDLKRWHPDLGVPSIDADLPAESTPRLVQALAEMNEGQRPLYTAYNKLEPPLAGWHLVSEGAVYRLVRDREALPLDPGALPATRFAASRLRGFTRRPLDARTLKLVVGDLAIKHNTVGVSLEEAGRLDQALAFYRRAASLQPESPEYPFNEGNVFNAQKRPEEAAAAYREAVARDPRYGAAWYNLGVTELGRGRSTAAIEAFKAALALDPQRQDLRQVLRQLGAGPS